MKPSDEEYLNHLDHSIKEIGRNGFQNEVTQGFRSAGHEFVYHTWSSKNSPKGFPDTVVPIRQNLVVIELKVGDNTPSDEQIKWLEAFAQTGALTFALWPRHRPVLRLLYGGKLHLSAVGERVGVYTRRGGD